MRFLPIFCRESLFAKVLVGELASPFNFFRPTSAKTALIQRESAAVFVCHPRCAFKVFCRSGTLPAWSMLICRDPAEGGRGPIPAEFAGAAAGEGMPGALRGAFSRGSGEEAERADPSHYFVRFGTRCEAPSLQPFCPFGQRFEIGRAGADAARSGCAEGHNRLAREIVALQECGDDPRRVAPPYCVSKLIQSTSCGYRFPIYEIATTYAIIHSSPRTHMVLGIVF